MRQRALEEYKKTLKFSVFQKKVLVGLLLGDGHIEVSPNKKSARLKVEYSVKNSDYVDFLYQAFKNLVRMIPRKRTIKSFGGIFERIGFTTLSLPDFKSFRDLFYRGKRKVVPSNINELLSDTGLAIWFMDDGSYKSKECKGKLICTHNFSREEINLLCQILKEKFGLEGNPRRQVDGIEIYIHASSFNRLKKLISPYLVSSFKYKLDSSLNNIA
ncbi:hypothetical protein HY030_00605 [Candidatus Gottesmanbacteria bacterium]|nr:hypothetical protein [Candidatus Gottesmanbacteria bacterium]